MKVTKIHFFFTAPNNLHWNKIGMEAEIVEGDDVRQCLYSLKNQVESFFYESTKADEKKEAIIKVEKEKRTPQDINIEAIQNCTEIEGSQGLKTFEKLASNNAVIKAMYDLQLKQLSK